MNSFRKNAETVYVFKKCTASQIWGDGHDWGFNLFSERWQSSVYWISATKGHTIITVCYVSLLYRERGGSLWWCSENMTWSCVDAVLKVGIVTLLIGWLVACLFF